LDVASVSNSAPLFTVISTALPDSSTVAIMGAPVSFRHTVQWHKLAAIGFFPTSTISTGMFKGGRVGEQQQLAGKADAKQNHT
jgi:hypothetical protein